MISKAEAEDHVSLLPASTQESATNTGLKQVQLSNVWPVVNRPTPRHKRYADDDYDRRGGRSRKKHYYDLRPQLGHSDDDYDDDDDSRHARYDRSPKSSKARRFSDRPSRSGGRDNEDSSAYNDSNEYDDSVSYEDYDGDYYDDDYYDDDYSEEDLESTRKERGRMGRYRGRGYRDSVRSRHRYREQYFDDDLKPRSRYSSRRQRRPSRRQHTRNYRRPVDDDDVVYKMRASSRRGPGRHSERHDQHYEDIDYYLGDEEVDRQYGRQGRSHTSSGRRYPPHHHDRYWDADYYSSDTADYSRGHARRPPHVQRSSYPKYSYEDHAPIRPAHRPRPMDSNQFPDVLGLLPKGHTDNLAGNGGDAKTTLAEDENSVKVSLSYICNTNLRPDPQHQAFTRHYHSGGRRARSIDQQEYPEKSKMKHDLEEHVMKLTVATTNMPWLSDSSTLGPIRRSDPIQKYDVPKEQNANKSEGDSVRNSENEKAVPGVAEARNDQYDAEPIGNEGLLDELSGGKTPRIYIQRPRGTLQQVPVQHIHHVGPKMDISCTAR